VTPQPPAPRWIGGLLAMGAFLAAAGLAVWGTFEKVSTYTSDRTGTDGPGSHYSASITWWDYQQTGESLARRHAFPPFGVLPALAAGLLVVGAVLALTAVAAGRAIGPVTASRFAATLGVGMLAGVTAIRLMDALDNLAELNAQDLRPGESFSFTVGLGLYLPGGAVLLGLLGLLLTVTRPRTRTEPATPPMGIPRPHPHPPADR
jgi:hypothetical protein